MARTKPYTTATTAAAYTDLQVLVLRAMVRASGYNGDDFGLLCDTFELVRPSGLTAQQFGGVVSSLIVRPEVFRYAPESVRVNDTDLSQFVLAPAMYDVVAAAAEPAPVAAPVEAPVAAPARMYMLEARTAEGWAPLGAVSTTTRAEAVKVARQRARVAGPAAAVVRARAVAA